MLRTARNFGGRDYNARFALFCIDPSLTIQSEKDESDINVIVGRFLKTGVAPQVILPPTFGDFTGGDFHSSLNDLNEARRVFEQIPAKIRRRFDNDPHKFVEFVLDKSNLKEMRELGIANPEVIHGSDDGKGGGQPVPKGGGTA